MELSIYNTTKAETNKRKLPIQFTEEIRPDLIERAVFAIRSHRKQPYGAKPDAGQRQVGKLRRRRNVYKTSYGHGISRVPRKILTRRGTQMFWVGAIAPGTVGGRRAHPPKVEKVIEEKINKKERKKAIRSAMTATMFAKIVEDHGHKVPKNYPFLLDNSFEELSKTKDIKLALNKLGLESELERSAKKKIRAGKGKMRGRKYRKRKGPLLVVSKSCNLSMSAKNIPGVEVVEVKNLNAELLAPGCIPGRLTLFTSGAIEKIEKEKMFM